MNILPSFLRSRRAVSAAWMLALMLLFVQTSLPMWAQSPQTVTPHISEMLKKHHADQKQAFTQPSQLMFIQNKGQWQGNAELGTPRYLAKLAGANVWVTDEGLVYDFYKSNPNTHKHLPPHLAALQRPEPSILGGHVVQMKFAGAKPNTKVYGVKQLPGYHNYFLGNDSTKWATNVPLYGETVIGNLYDGISAKVYFEGASVRYDMIVQPGADPRQIALAFDGAEDVFTNAAGDLVMKTSLGDVVQGKLFAYQVKDGKRVQVACRFTTLPLSSRATAKKPSDGVGGGLSADTFPPSDRLPSSARSHGLTADAPDKARISFALGSYDPALPLVIDPLVWSTFLGGSGEDDLYHAVSFDASNNVYTAGRTQSTNFPTTGGAYQTTYPGGTYCGVVTKLNPTGTGLIFSTFLGGGALSMNAMALDASNNIYVTGSCGPTYPITLGSYGGNTVDMIITKLNAAGNALLYSRYFGGSADESAYDISVDGSGNAYVSGHTYSNDFIVTGGVYQSVRNGLSDGAVCKIDNTGNVIFSTYIGGSNDDFPIFNEIDASGNVYLMGYSKGSYPTTGGAVQPSFGGGNLDIVVTKMNSTGTGLIYSTYLGGLGDEIARGLVLDASNNIYVSGNSTGVTPITLGPAYAGGTSDGILFSLNAAGSALNFSRYIGGSGQDDLLSLCRDAGTGDIYAVGFTDSPNYPTSLGAYQTAIAGGYDIVVTKLNSAASTILYSSYIGGANDDIGKFIAFNATNTVFLSGTASGGFPTTIGAFQTPYGGGTADGFVTKFSTVPEPPTVSGFTPTSAYPMQVVTITGTNFTGATQVQFGATNAAWYIVDSPTQIRAVVPFGGVSSAISVITPGGTATSGSSLTVTAAPQVSTLAGTPTTLGYLDAVGQASLLNYPYCGVKIANDIYFTDFSGNRVRKFNIPTGAVTTIAGSGIAGYLDGTGTAAQFNSPAGIASDGTNLYVGEAGNHTIRRIVIATGVVTTIAGLGGTSGFADGTGPAARFFRVGGLTWDGTNIYACDVDNHRIRKITTGGVVTTFAGSGTAGNTDGVGVAAQFNRPQGITFAGGFLYIAGNYGNNIRRIDVATANVQIIAGSPAGTPGFTDGIGTAALFNLPVDIVHDGANTLYITESANHTIRSLSLGANAVSTYVGTNTASFADGTYTAARFNQPVGLIYDAPGILYVMDHSNHAIRRVSPAPPTVTGFTATTGYPGLGIVINGTNFIGVTQVQFGGVNSPSFTVISPTQLVAAVPAGGASGSVSVTNPGGTGSLAGFTFTGTVPQVSTFAGNGAGAGYADGTQGAAMFNNPYGIAIDGGGNIYEADRYNHRIRKITPAGVVTTLAGSGTAGWNDATGTAAQFNQPAGLAVDGAGNVYVADAQNHRIRKITSGGVVTTLAGSGVAGWNDATGAAAQFYAPYGLVVDGANNVYVADANNNRIRKITSGGVVTTFAGSGVAGWNDATGTAAQFNAPQFVALDGSGNLYVGDNLNHRIRKITSAGVVTTLAGSGVAGFADATGAAAQFNQPYGVTVDATGNVYVADATNHRIRVVSPLGSVSTLAGTGTAGFADGTAAAAQFNNPHSIVVDAMGNLYVGDYNNHRIRKIAPAPPTVTSFTPTSAYPMQVVTITGTNLSGASQVQFGATNAAWYVVDSPTQIRAVVPLTAVNGAVSVTTPAGTASLAGFTVAATPAISTYTGGSPGNVHAAGQATQINSPVGMVQSALGDIYIAEVANDIIRKISAAGVSSVFAGTGTGGPIIDGTGTAAQFQNPHGMAIDGAGNLYVCDYDNHAIRKITPAGVVTTLAGNGTPGDADGVGGAQFRAPIGITFSSFGGNFVYVTEDSGHRIRKVDVATGNVTTLAGSPTATSGYLDATGTTALFNGARGIVVNAVGEIFVTDFNNNRIRKITQAGVVTTLAGSGGGFADGTGAAAQFSQPRGITIDAAGNLYVADNNRIRLVTSCGAVTSIAGSGGGGSADGTLTTGQLSGGVESLLFSVANGDLIACDRNQAKIRQISLTRYQFVSGDAGIATNWRRLPALVVGAPDFVSYGSVFTVSAGVTAAAFTAFTLGANTAITVADNATLSLNNTTLTNGGILSIADGATGGRLLVNGTGSVLTNAACYAGVNSTLESAGGTAKTLSTVEFPSPMPGKVVITNTVGTTTPASVTMSATGTVSVNAGARMIIPNGASVLNNNAAPTSFTVQSGGTLEVSGTGQVAAGSASVVNYPAGSTLEYSGGVAKTTNAQEFPAAMFGNLVITNTAQVILDAAKILGASATLTLTAGRIVTSGANMLTVANTLATAVTATAGYVDGPLQRDMPASLAAPAVTYSFPIGIGGMAYPFAISNPTTGVPGPRLQVQAFAANAGGTAGTGISLLSTTEYWQMQQISGAYTSGIIFLQKAGLTATNTIGGNPIVPTGTYNGFTSTFGTGLTTVAPVTGTGCFLVGTGPIIYDWVGAPGADWQIAANWSPNRTTPAPTDILRFNAGTHTPTNLPNQTIQQLIIGGDVTLASGAAQTITVGSGGVQITAGNSLNLGNIILTQAAGATLQVDGTLNTANSYVNGAGNFTLSASGTLATSRTDGINGNGLAQGAVQFTGPITYTAGASYTFNASGGAINTRFTAIAGKPAVTANPIGTLSINTANADITLDANTTINGAMTVQGSNPYTYIVGANQITLGASATVTVFTNGRVGVNAGGSILNNNASPTSFTVNGFFVLKDNGQVDPASASALNFMPGSILEYTGTLPKTTTVKEIGAAGAQNVLISNTAPVTLGANMLVQQNLTVNNGSKLVLSNVGNPILSLNGSINLNATGLLASVNGANAGSITLGGAGAISLRMDATDNTLNNFTVNRSGTHTIAGDLNVRGTLTLTNGVLAPTTHIFSGDPTGTAAGVITGGSANSYIQGKLQRRFTGGIVAAGTSYDFPVGTSVVGYRPATLVNVLTGASPVVQVENFDTGAMTYDASLTALLSPRNWSVQLIAGVFNGSAIALFDAGTNAGNVVARSALQAGMYAGFGGSLSVQTVTSNAGAVPAAVNHYFALGSVQPFISMVSPSTISPGDTVTITGNQLGSVSAISFGGTPAASFQVISQTEIRAVVGSGSSGPITLIYPGGVAPSMQTITFMNAPVITSFDPTYGTTGSTVRITGQRLSNPTNVSFGGVNGLNIRSIDANTLDATVGLGASGPVSVQTQSGSVTSVATFDFIVKPSIVNFFPKWGKIADTVNIFGGNFQRVSSVRFGTSAPILNFTLVTSGQIRVLVPPDVATGIIRLTNPVGTESSWTNFIYTAPPRLQSVFPNPIIPVGQAITLTGGEFHPVPRVMIGTTTAATVEWTDMTQIKATFAQATTGILSIYASGGTVSLATPVQVVLPPVIESFAPRYPSPGDQVTVTGANFFAGFISLSIGGVPVSGLAIQSSTQLTFTVPPTVAGPLTITTPGGLSVVATGQTVNVVPQPQITGSSGITTATIGQSLILQGTGLMNIVAFTLGGVDVTNFTPIGTTGTVLQMSIPHIPGVDSAAAEIITTEATIALLTRSGIATYTLFVRNRNVSGTTGTSTNGTTPGGGGTSTLMRITSVSPVSLPEGSTITLNHYIARGEHCHQCNGLGGKRRKYAKYEFATIKH